MENENETYLSDWLANKISDEQLKQLVTEEEFVDYQKLKNTLDNFTVSNPDLDKNFAEIKQKFESHRAKKPVKIVPIWRYASIAAALLFCLGLFQLFYFSNVNTTGFRAVKILTLPDNSQVTLNSDSKLSYPNLFQYNRTLNLEGEAFFEVQKGSTFTVKTRLGSVKVLGTKFNVNCFKDYFEVVCYRGKVRVQSKDKFTILTPTESVRFYGNTFENWADNSAQKPSWLSGETSFKNVPMKYVIDQFKRQYKVEVLYKKNIDEVKFTGAFSNNNLQTALKSICVPLHLNFATTDDERKIVISE
jgi:ferric-dicitrate binding protein FerR (iron transport regulator)